MPQFKKGTERGQRREEIVRVLLSISFAGCIVILNAYSFTSRELAVLLVTVVRGESDTHGCGERRARFSGSEGVDDSFPSKVTRSNQ